MKRFKIGGVPEHFNLPWRLAIEDGDFQKNGVEIHWADMSGGTGQMIKGLQTGSIDIAVLLTEGITNCLGTIFTIHGGTYYSACVSCTFGTRIQTFYLNMLKCFFVSWYANWR